MTEYKREMISGSSNEKTYLVVGTIEGLALAVCPVVLLKKDAAFLGFRVRLCNLGHQTINIKEVLEKTVLGVIKWGQVDNTRASLMQGGVIPTKALFAHISVTGKGCGFTKPLMQGLHECNFIEHLRNDFEKQFKLDCPKQEFDDFIISGITKKLLVIEKYITHEINKANKTRMFVPGNDTIQ